jgi:hypothetical protein
VTVSVTIVSLLVAGMERDGRREREAFSVSI